MIHPNEVRIGNLVDFEGKPVKITAATSWMPYINTDRVIGWHMLDGI